MGIFKNEDDNIKKYLYLYNESNFTLVCIFTNGILFG